MEYTWTADEESAAQPAGEEGVSSPVPGSGSWTLLSETRYLYDGMRVIQERDGSNTPLVSYTRGNDLSGRLEGAGGIGGLLGRSHGYSSGNGSTHNFYHSDGNGNITYLVDSSQALAASYRYDPFGNTISSSGSLAAANVYRFSSKEIHINSGLYYYGYRWYEPNLQRWLNRDPIAELGFETIRATRRWVLSSRNPSMSGFRGRSRSGFGSTLEALLSDAGNLHTFVGNSPIDEIDPEGLAPLTEQEILRMLEQLRNQLNNKKPPGSEGEKALLREMDKWLDRLNRLKKPPTPGPGGASLLGRTCLVAGAGVAGYAGGRALGNSTPYAGGGTWDENVQEAIFRPFWDWYYGTK